MTENMNMGTTHESTSKPMLHWTQQEQMRNE
jgi:hypothetical protein